MIIIAMIELCGHREPMAVLDYHFEIKYPALANAICDYAEGKIEPHYPVPALRRRVKYGDLWSVLRWINFLPSGAQRF